MEATVHQRTTANITKDLIKREGEEEVVEAEAAEDITTEEETTTMIMMEIQATSQRTGVTEEEQEEVAEGITGGEEGIIEEEEETIEGEEEVITKDITRGVMEIMKKGRLLPPVLVATRSAGIEKEALEGTTTKETKKSCNTNMKEKKNSGGRDPSLNGLSA